MYRNALRDELRNAIRNAHRIVVRSVGVTKEKVTKRKLYYYITLIIPVAFVVYSLAISMLK